MQYELTKHEKKIARLLIDKGTDTEFKIALEQADEILSLWKQGKLDNDTAYHKLYKKIEQADKRIGDRYNGLRGGDYLLAVAGIYMDGQINEEDLKGFSEQARAILNWLKSNTEG